MRFEKRLWALGNVFTLLVVLLSLRLVYWQMARGDLLSPVLFDPVVAAGRYAGGLKSVRQDPGETIKLISADPALTSLQDLPQPVIQRTVDLLGTITRGSIYDRAGRLLAFDRIEEDGNRTRFYNEPSLAPVIGYVSGLRTGIAGLEYTYNETLLGLNRLDAQISRMVKEPVTGSDLVLTLDSGLQQAAEEALAGHSGTVVILDGESGAVLAMASLPRFDPNRILEPGYVEELTSECDEAACAAPFLNRAVQALYTPGSTWKTVTLIAGLDSGRLAPERVFDFGEPRQGPDGPYYVYEVEGGVIPDPNHREAQLSLELSYAKSANAAFARIADELPPEVLIEYATRLGLHAPDRERFPVELPALSSQVAAEVDRLYESRLLRAATGIGQGELLVTPLDMARLVLAVLNRGDMPTPHLVAEIRHPSGEVSPGPLVEQVVPGVMKPETASLVREMMIAVVEQGSGRKAQVPGLVVGGKTGTAQVGGDRLPHAWFTGFAEADGRSVVIAVLVEHSGEGSQVAAPIFAQLAQAALLQPAQAAPEERPEDSPPGPTPTAVLEPTPTPAPSPDEQEPPPAEEGGVPLPDIPYDPGKVDFTEVARQSCPGIKDGPVGTGQFVWPSVYQALSGGDFREGHPGLDLSAPQGTAVYAADTGQVVFAGWSGAIGYGNAIVIDHGNGFITLYAHLSQVSKHCGAKVQAGDLIGLSGNTGNSGGPHLHFEVRVPGGYLNPLKVLPIPN